MTSKFYNTLPEDAKMIREKVFMQEQGFQNEFDETDHHCLHLVLYKDNKPVGCARMFDEDGVMTLGRIAVLKEYRHLHLGSELLKALEAKAKELGYSKTVLSAQSRVKQFYMNNGYQPLGDEYYDEHCLHTHMEKIL